MPKAARRTPKPSPTDDLLAFISSLPASRVCRICLLPADVRAALRAGRNAHPRVSYPRLAQWLLDRGYITGAPKSSLGIHFRRGHEEKSA